MTLEITIKEETSIKDLSNAYKNLKKLYKERRDNELCEIRNFLHEHREEAFTARELSNMSGVSVQAIVNSFRRFSQIGYRPRCIHTTYVKMNVDGSIDYSNKVDHKITINEYFWRQAY